MPYTDEKYHTEDNEQRAEPGSLGEGAYYRIVVRPKEQFVTFRYQDVGKPRGMLRLAGKKANGRWFDHAWLIEKHMAHVAGDALIPATREAAEVLEAIGPTKKVKGDIFKGYMKKGAEKEKITPSQRKAQKEKLDSDKAYLTHQGL